MLDDGDVLEQARRGDEAAWRLLYERHVELVFGLALRAVGDRDAALDVVQETFVRAARGLDGFRGEASFGSWIGRIAINESRSWLRRRARRREVSLEAGPERPDPGDPPDAALVRENLAERALAFVRSLPDLQREAILLRTSEGYSYRKIGELLGTTEGSARVSYHLGMARLREYLTGGAGRAPGSDPGRVQEGGREPVQEDGRDAPEAGGRRE